METQPVDSINIHQEDPCGAAGPTGAYNGYIDIIGYSGRYGFMRELTIFTKRQQKKELRKRRHETIYNQNKMFK